MSSEAFYLRNYFYDSYLWLDIQKEVNVIRHYFHFKH